MAIQQTVATRFGVDATFWVLKRVRVLIQEGSVTGFYDGYASSDAYAAGAQAIAQQTDETLDPSKVNVAKPGTVTTLADVVAQLSTSVEAAKVALAGKQGVPISVVDTPAIAQVQNLQVQNVKVGG